MRIAIHGFVAVLLTLSAVAQPKPHTRVALLLPVETARPGDTVLAGIQMKMDRGWHTYWKNSGESGAPTEIEWNLPAGVTAGEIQWPAPERYTADELTTFVLHDQAMLLVPLHLAKDLTPGPLKLAAEISWLECEELCIPGSGEVSVTLNIGEEAKSSPKAAQIEAAKAQLPQMDGVLVLKAQWEGPATNHTRNLIFEWPATDGAKEPDFFPYTSDDYEVGLTPERLPVDASRIAMRVPVKSETGTWPGQIGGVIVQTVDGKQQSYAVQITPEKDASVAAEVLPPATRAGGDAKATGILKFLVLALLGGLILNLMPCVLPILSLKVLSLVNQQGVSATEARKHAVVYALGVLVSFWAASGLVIAGSLASVGAQFQFAPFVVAMTVLVTLVSLNLFGVFEVVLPGITINKANELAGREGLPGAFFKGVLAVVLGASCVAPVFAPAVGWAWSQPPPIILLSFTMVGIGLASPFVLISFFPTLRRFLPKPGAWMEKFKVAMGFPMLATAAWLLSQTADHFGSRGPLWVGLFLVVLGFAAWIYGEFHQRGRKRRGLAAIIALLIAAGGYGWALERELNWRHPPTDFSESSTPKNANGASGIPWQQWSPEAVAKARAEGRPVLVDFTANWCLTCQLNKKTSLEIESVRKKLKEINAVALLGDYTRKNPEITAELNRFERAGVPLVLVYPKDATKPPQLLPTVLTPSIVLEALDAAAK